MQAFWFSVRSCVMIRTPTLKTVQTAHSKIVKKAHLKKKKKKKKKRKNKFRACACVGAQPRPTREKLPDRSYGPNGRTVIAPFDLGPQEIVGKDHISTLMIRECSIVRFYHNMKRLRWWILKISVSSCPRTLPWFFRWAGCPSQSQYPQLMSGKLEILQKRR